MGQSHARQFIVPEHEQMRRLRWNQYRCQIQWGLATS